MSTAEYWDFDLVDDFDITPTPDERIHILIVESKGRFIPLQHASADTYHGPRRHIMAAATTKALAAYPGFWADQYDFVAIRSAVIDLRASFSFASAKAAKRAVKDFLFAIEVA